MTEFLSLFLSPHTLLGAITLGVGLFSSATAVALMIRRTTRRIVLHLTDVTGLNFLSALAQLVVYLVGFVLYAHLIPELRVLGTALLTGVSLVSVVIGIAAQSTLGNLIAGISLVLYRPFSVGDVIEINTPKGIIPATVYSISLGYIKFRDINQFEILVPNSTMMGSVITKVHQV